MSTMTAYPYPSAPYSTALVLSLPTCPTYWSTETIPEFKFRYKLLMLVATIWPFIWIAVVLRNVFVYCNRSDDTVTPDYHEPPHKLAIDDKPPSTPIKVRRSPRLLHESLLIKVYNELTKEGQSARTILAKLTPTDPSITKSDVNSCLYKLLAASKASVENPMQTSPKWTVA
jgi:hypothetical protein